MGARGLNAKEESASLRALREAYTTEGALVTCGGHDDVERFYWLQPLLCWVGVHERRLHLLVKAPVVGELSSIFV